MKNGQFLECPKIHLRYRNLTKKIKELKYLFNISLYEMKKNAVKK